MGSSSTHSSGFSSVMRDRQARNKDPATGVSYSSLDDKEGRMAAPRNLNRGSKDPGWIAVAGDAYESFEKRRWAASILDSPELLLMHSLSRGDSIPGTKHHFTKILCGYDDPLKPTDKNAMAKKEKDTPLTEKVCKPVAGTIEM